MVLHEFRGLALFALHRYKEAAGTIYAVLSIGPGWDWTTLSGFYPDVDIYTQQHLHPATLRVGAVCRRDSNEADVRFLAAYHCLTCGHTDRAAEQFKWVAPLNPKDQLSAQLLAALTTTEAPSQTAASEPAKPVTTTTLAGPSKRRGYDRTEPRQR